jgi:beta-mannosidase
MTARHAIRLRGPWECEPLGAGRARSTRRFNCPTNLEPHERVWLVFDGFDSDAEVTLNGQPLGRFAAGDCPREFEITSLLEPHNVVSVEASRRADGAGSLAGEVRLEIGV